MFPLQDNFYLSFLQKYEYIEITPDICIFDYKEAVKENLYLEKNFSEISHFFWLIGKTGQGDEWFLNKENNYIFFYDHNQGEYLSTKQFSSLNIYFFDFLQMAFLYQELENLLDKQEEIGKEQEDIFKHLINSIYPDLYKLYPFKYFD